MELSNLPSELIAQIFAFLDDADVFTARLSCRNLEKASFAHFGKRFFRKKGFMITSFSLGVLQRIAEHQELRKYMQHVWFNPDCYTFLQPLCVLSHDDNDLDENDDFLGPTEESIATTHAKNLLGEQYHVYRSCARDHHKLMHTPLLEQRLIDAFTHFPNLVTIGMRRSEDYGPYGWTILRDSIGEDPRVLGPIPIGPTSRLSGPTQLFIAILRAVASTSVQLRRFYTDAVEIDNIEERMLPRSVLHRACNSIWYVELNATRGRLHPHTDEDRARERHYITLESPDHYGSGVSRLFAAMPNLKEIGLQIFPDRKQSHLIPPNAQNPDSWRQSYPYATLSRLVRDTTLPHLTRVKLEKVTTIPEILQRFLQPCASHLTSLKLRDVRLLSSGDGPRPWQSFFTFLRDQCQEINYVLLYHLLYDRGGVSFVPDPAPAVLSDTQDHILSHLPQARGRNALFAKYEDITLELSGAEKVRAKLDEVIERHWYHKPLFSYAMDEDLWHTDTSDEEW